MRPFDAVDLALNEPVPPDAIQDDLTAEKEAHSPQAWALVDEEEKTSQGSGLVSWTESLDGAATGITEKTLSSYNRLISNYKAWVQKKGFFKDGGDPFAEKLPEDVPSIISLWIMESCDPLQLDGTTRQDSRQLTYSNAMKMRAAMTYAYGRLKTRGRQSWYRAEDGRWLGNPSVSDRVARYMISLHRRKVRGGEVAMSARAITPEIIRVIFEYNQDRANWHSSDRQENSRLLTHSAAALAFSCLLRFDEVMRIDLSHITIIGKTCIRLELPFRKTHQEGNIKPFYLHVRPINEAYMCPVRALQNWLKVRGRSGGFLFPPIKRGDVIGPRAKSISAGQFLELFRHSLVDVGIDPDPYGTHSFRRGGCQWLSTSCRWPLRRICDWGGWSMELTSLTIVKYLISCNDDPLEDRQDYMNPNRAPAVRCYVCGRTCHCG